MTPIDEETTEIRIGFLRQKKMLETDANRDLLEQYMKGHAGVHDQDIPIWAAKKFRPTPTLCDGDGPIGDFRKWTAQFYSEPRAEI